MSLVYRVASPEDLARADRMGMLAMVRNRQVSGLSRNRSSFGPTGVELKRKRQNMERQALHDRFAELDEEVQVARISEALHHPTGDVLATSSKARAEHRFMMAQAKDRHDKMVKSVLDW